MPKIAAVKPRPPKYATREELEAVQREISVQAEILLTESDVKALIPESPNFFELVGLMALVAVLVSLAFCYGQYLLNPLASEKQLIEAITMAQKAQDAKLKEALDKLSVSEIFCEGGPCTAATPNSKQISSSFQDDGLRQFQVDAPSNCWIELRVDGVVVPNLVYTPRGKKAMVRAGCPGKVEYYVDGNQRYPENRSGTPDKSEVVELP
jgi:hypothetical protein